MEVALQQALMIHPIQVLPVAMTQAAVLIQAAVVVLIERESNMSIDKDAVTCPDCGYKGRIEDLTDPEPEDENACNGEWCPKCGSGDWEFDFILEENRMIIERCKEMWGTTPDENEIYDIIDEINTIYDGSIEKWYQFEKEVRKYQTIF